MKKRKKRQLVSWLLVFMMIWNVLSPLNTVWAEGLDAWNDHLDSVIETSGHDNAASNSQAHNPKASGEEETTNVPDKSAGRDTGQKESTPATDSNAFDPSDKGTLLPETELMGLEPPAGSRDVTALLKDLAVTIKQNGSSVTEITAGQDFTVEGSFRIPVAGDGISDPDQCVSQGDYAILQLDANITVTNSNPLDLIFKGEKVGTLTFMANPSQVKILFDGDSMKDPSAANVNCEFGSTMKYTGSDVTEENPKNNVLILNKEFTVKAQEIPLTQTQTKSGQITDDKTEIQWTVTVNAKKSSDISLTDYQFQDDLSNVGEFVEDSFKINDMKPDPNVTPDTNNVLSYKFGDVKGTQTITFRTKIPGDMLITGGTISNTAKFGKDTLVNTNPADVSISSKKLIEKRGTAGDGLNEDTYNPNNRTITWTITANQDQIPLSDLTITDNLPTNPSGLSWKSAKWEYESGANTWTELTPGDGLTDVPSYAEEPTGGIYKLTGTTSKKVRVTIVCKVDDSAYVGTVKTYKNSATLTWSGMPGKTFSSDDKVNIGIDGLTKNFVSTDYASRKITWRATVDLKKQSGFQNPKTSIKVYDLLIYDSNNVDLETTNLNTLVGGEYKNLTPKYGQKIVENSWSDGLTYEIKPVMVDNTRIGDLLVVSGFDIDKPYSFTFQSQVLDPNVFAASTGRWVGNTASLYYGTMHLDDGNDKTTYYSNVLSKQVLKSGTNTIGDRTNGFNSLDKTVVFRLNINTDGYDLTGAAIKNGTLGNVTVSDTLPDGWSFVDIGSNVKYQLYDSSNTLILNQSDILENVDISEKSADFVFKKLDKAYYVLVKAKLSDEQYLKYLETSYSNGRTDQFQTATNTVQMTAEGDKNWNPSGTESVQVPTQFLIKSVNGNKTPLEWTIKFNPFDLPGFKNIKITDQIPEGLELPFERNGSLSLDAFTITEYDQMTNGAFPTSGGRVLTIPQLQDRLTYDKTLRVLTFTPADGKLYQIVYTTEVTGNVGANLKNQVTVSGSTINSTGTNAFYRVDDSHASATLERNGYLDIRKVNDKNQILNGAVFTLYADKMLQTPLRTSIVRPDNTLRISAIPAPKAFGDPALTYYLKETMVPNTYESDNMVYLVTVTKDSNNKAVTTVAGKTAGQPLTVVNYQSGVVGKLSIRKIVEGNAGDSNKAFNFTIQLTGQNVDNTYNYIGSGNKENGQLTITGGLGTVQLKHKEGITITGLPKDVTYLITEEDYSADGYDTSSTLKAGTIKANEEQTVTFTNTKYLPGSLTIKKTVAGNSHENKDFEFTVAFTKPDKTPDSNVYHFTGTGGAPDGTIQNGGKITLSSGQSINITGLPKDTTYAVTEKDYSGSGYSTVSTDPSGTIVTGMEQTASFVNTKVMPGSLTISKTVAGTGADTKKKFEFTVTFHASGTYSYIGNGVPDGTIQSGDKISLADGESITIMGLPDGTGYQVTEADYSKERYTLSKTGDTGVVHPLETAIAAFTNSYHNPTSSSGGSKGGDPKVPVKTTEPGKPTPSDPTINRDSKIPTGDMEGKTPPEPVDINNRVPTGTLLERNGLPKTGDDYSRDMAMYGLLCISAFLSMLACAILLRKKHFQK